MKKEDFERACDIKKEETQLFSQLCMLESGILFDLKLYESCSESCSPFLVFYPDTDDLAKDFVEAVKNRLRGQIEKLEKEFAEL